MKTVLYILLIGIIANMLLTPYVRKEGFKGRKALLLLHMEGCPHCVKLMPEWDNFTKMNDTSITTKSIEKDEDRSLVKRYGVEGFPTILLVDSNGDKLKTYSGPRTAQGLLDFCHQNS
jgi:protein disulfide-isomerase A6|tara:strand:+ start:386 stop:739 length:354 start_codon:yes stop_codon:yes gene_type:complete